MGLEKGKRGFRRASSPSRHASVAPERERDTSGRCCQFEFDDARNTGVLRERSAGRQRKERRSQCRVWGHTCTGKAKGVVSSPGAGAGGCRLWEEGPSGTRRRENHQHRVACVSAGPRGELQGRAYSKGGKGLQFLRCARSGARGKARSRWMAGQSSKKQWRGGRDDASRTAGCAAESGSIIFKAELGGAAASGTGCKSSGVACSGHGHAWWCVWVGGGKMTHTNGEVLGWRAWQRWGKTWGGGWWWAGQEGCR